MRLLSIPTLLVAALAAASLPAAPSAPAQPEPDGALTLTLSGACPGWLSWSIAGGTPHGRVVLVLAKNPGSAIVPRGPCKGMVLGLDRTARWVWGTKLPASGSVGGGISPYDLCDVYFQAVDIATCTASNVVKFP